MRTQWIRAPGGSCPLCAGSEEARRYLFFFFFLARLLVSSFVLIRDARTSRNASCF